MISLITTQHATIYIFVFNLANLSRPTNNTVTVFFFRYASNNLLPSV